jgi:hypothetical protein
MPDPDRIRRPYRLLRRIRFQFIDSTWGEEVDKEKGSKIIFTCKQSVPMAFYEGAVTFDPSSASW